jgi:cellulose synthase/poly-beta-1,6-N-acetylglucosamine synthase-like glycosyltransferase
MPELCESIARYAVLAVYFGSLLGMSIFGLHRWSLVWHYWRGRRRVPLPRRAYATLPRLTVQLPMYNELYVAERLIDAVTSLDYPRDRLEIQVLDDSTDETSAVCARVVADKRAEGFDIVHLHRALRDGYKAGALAQGLRVAKGELIAIFDADFVPPRDFARRIVPYFTDPAIGMVQSRWGHLNARHSALTRVQSMFLDGHFVIEQTARNRSGRFFNFNGTAGIWRKRSIEDAGGWQHDTLTEDLDLSYRAQMRGWRFVFLNEHVTPAELPLEMGAFKSQQHRWAKGSIQTARKLLPGLLASDLPWKVKLESICHLTANVGYLLMVVLALTSVPSIWFRQDVVPWMFALVDLPIFTLSTVSVVAFYVVAHREATGSWLGSARWVPFMMAIGIGLSINNARAVTEAILGRTSEFKRTPKYNLNAGENFAARRYRVAVNPDTWFEFVLALHFGVAILATAWAGFWGAVPFLLLFGVGYGYTSLAALVQAARRQKLSPPFAGT